MSNQQSTAVGVFRNRDQATRAVQELKQAGFRDDQIGYTMPGGTGEPAGTGGETGSAGGHVIGGAMAGGVLGGIAGALAAGLIPGIGPIIAGGILAATVGGAALGAAGGGLIGALTGLGVPEDEARYYEGEARSGRILVTVKSDGRYDEAKSILQGAGAYDMESQQRPEFQTVQPAESQHMPLMEEKLVPRKETVETGNVRLGKEVVTEQRQVSVPVQHEEVVLERHPVEARPAQGASIGEGEVRVPVHEEQVRVEKQPVVKEEVSVGKRQIEETQQISGEIRREEPRLETDVQP